MDMNLSKHEYLAIKCTVSRTACQILLLRIFCAVLLASESTRGMPFALWGITNGEPILTLRSLHVAAHELFMANDKQPAMDT